MRTPALVFGAALALLSSTALAASPIVAIGGETLSSTSGPALPASNLSVSHCGYQVPDGAVVRSDGSIVDSQGNALKANVVCSYAELAGNQSSHGSASNVKQSASIMSQAAIQAANSLTVQETYQGTPNSSGWYSSTFVIAVPTSTALPNNNNATFRFISGLLAGGSDQTDIAGVLQYTNNAFTAYAMQESASNSPPVYSQAITNVRPGDTLIVTVQEAPQFLFWDVTINDQNSGQSRHINVQYDPAMPWSIQAMDAREVNGGSPIASCSELPAFTAVHFGSPQLYPDNGERNPSNIVGFNPGYYNVSKGNQQPACQWSDLIQSDSGNQAGFSDLIFGCTEGGECGGSCGLIPSFCTPDRVNCGGCPSGQVCSTAAGNSCQLACTPTTSCATQGDSCGSVSDGCGNTLNCGTCTGNRAICVGGACLCTATTCAALGASCGTVGNGCGGTLTCGPACKAPPAAPAAPAMPWPMKVAMCGVLLMVGTVVAKRKERLV
jgi:hypothetical protein